MTEMVRSIRGRREALGLSVAKAARLIGVSSGILSRAEQGKIPQRAANAHYIAAFCGVRLERAADLARIEEWAPEVKSWDAEAVAA